MRSAASVTRTCACARAISPWCAESVSCTSSRCAVFASVRAADSACDTVFFCASASSRSVSARANDTLTFACKSSASSATTSANSRWATFAICACSWRDFATRSDAAWRRSRSALPRTLDSRSSAVRSDRRASVSIARTAVSASEARSRSLVDGSPSSGSRSTRAKRSATSANSFWSFVTRSAASAPRCSARSASCTTPDSCAVARVRASVRTFIRL